MQGFAFFVGGVLPYLAIAVFVIGMLYRIQVWRKTPQPGKMALTVGEEKSLFKGLVTEALFFPSLFKGDRTLWFFSWVFHASLALVFLGHLRVVTGLIDSILMAVGVSAAGINFMSTSLGGAAGIVMLATGSMLLIRRFTTRRVKEITNFADVFAMLLLLAIIVTGDMMRFVGAAHIDLVATRAWAFSLLTFSPNVSAVGTNATFLVHALLAQFLFMYIPFSKIMHFGGIFFTHALVQRR